MSPSGHDHATPSVTDGDGVRVVRERRSLLSVATAIKVLAAVLVVAGLATLLLPPPTPPTPPTATARSGASATSPLNRTSAENRSAETPAAAPARVAATTVRAPQHHATVHAMPNTRDPDDLPSGDPNDLATYLSPTDPAPTMSEVIQALHDSGDHTGIGAFNPPGTSPPLAGLAVPEDFDLPPGYVRHHQVTDEGEVLEPILMFSPDGVFVDASGREIPIPDDRVVPADMAPPGLVIREITVPPAGKRQP